MGEPSAIYLHSKRSMISTTIVVVVEEEEEMRAI